MAQFTMEEIEKNCPKEPKDPKKVTYAVYHVTFTTHPDKQLTQDVLAKRIDRVLRSKKYPITNHYGCYERTIAGAIHAHVLFVHQLNNRPDGRPNYPYEAWYKQANDGDMVKKQTVKSLQDTLNVINYQEKHPESITFGDKQALIQKVTKIENDKIESQTHKTCIPAEADTPNQPINTADD